MLIYEKIKLLRVMKGMSQQDLADRVGFKTASAINKIEMGLRDINHSKIMAFAKALSVSPSYLLDGELTENKYAKLSPFEYDNRTEFLKEFGLQVRKYRIEKGLSQEALANLMGYTSENARSSVNKIESGKSDLPASKIQLLAIALDVSIDSLMAQESKTLTEQIIQNYRQRTSEAFQMYLRLDDNDQGEICGKMKQMLEAEKYLDKDDS